MLISPFSFLLSPLFLLPLSFLSLLLSSLSSFSPPSFSPPSPSPSPPSPPSHSSQVFTWGCNDEGALGRKIEEGGEYTPGMVDKMGHVKIVQVSAGDSHTAALANNGNVYCWGVFRVSIRHTSSVTILINALLLNIFSLHLKSYDVVFQLVRVVFMCKKDCWFQSRPSVVWE